MFAFEHATANNAMLEAMAWVPVVAAGIGGIGEYITSETGILCPAKDSTALATATRRLLDDAALQRKMGRTARVRALGLNFKIAAEQMLAIYTQALADVGTTGWGRRLSRAQGDLGLHGVSLG